MKCQFKKSVKHYILTEDNNLLYESKTKIFKMGILNWHGLVQFIHRDIPKILINSHLVITLS